jgi:hypothetical protein
MYFRFGKAFATENMRPLGYEYCPPLVWELAAVRLTCCPLEFVSGIEWKLNLKSVLQRESESCDEGPVLHCVRNLTKKSWKYYLMTSYVYVIMSTTHLRSHNRRSALSVYFQLIKLKLALCLTNEEATLKMDVLF